MAVYRGITFAKGYNRSFAEFKEEFASTHVFKNIPKSKREAELKKAWKIATKDELSRSKSKGGKSKSAKDKS